MRAPAFWAADGGGVAPLLLRPFEPLTARVTAARIARPGWRAPVPVFCCGNAGVGGAGKTTVALDLGRRLRARGVALHFVIRGYGRRSRGVVRVDPARHDAAAVGDEALLLAAVAPTWIAADRAAAARAAVAAGAAALLLDDGLQNPTLVKDCSLLVIDGAAGFGNGRLLPAGPLREPVAAAAARCTAAILIGADRRGALAPLPRGMPVLRARLVPAGQAQALAGRRVLGFAGIAYPEKFFTTLAECGAELTARAAFPDHHRFAESELRRLAARAAHLNATLVTTAKDAARLVPTWRDRVCVLDVALAWDDPAAIESLLAAFPSDSSLRPGAERE
jgi:tetraacyldisaccharide 4'-kinase